MYPYTVDPLQYIGPYSTIYIGTTHIWCSFYTKRYCLYTIGVVQCRGTLFVPHSIIGYLCMVAIHRWFLATLLNPYSILRQTITVYNRSYLNPFLAVLIYTFLRDGNYGQ